MNAQQECMGPGAKQNRLSILHNEMIFIYSALLSPFQVSFNLSTALLFLNLTVLSTSIPMSN